MKSYIIGIAGCKNSGKDTVASMIDYIFCVGSTKAAYHNYMMHKNAYGENSTNKRCIHFADGLKDILSVIYNIPRFYFDDREYKDRYYYNLKANTFVPENVVKNEPGAEIVTIDRLKSFSLNILIEYARERQVYIKLRTLMQYFGTNICREQLADDIWIRQTLSKAVDIAEGRRLCLIPDVRFANEAIAIQKNTDYLYGGVIKIKRDNYKQDLHTSEFINFDCDYTIDNNGSLMSLFYKVLDIIQNILNK